jgi:alkanesulfonate monooxygenase SsuD/methylene tetrahydromethanopterin reductase-like flavin-dependent oxidoreductase (luciferase family)
MYLLASISVCGRRAYTECRCIYASEAYQFQERRKMATIDFGFMLQPTARQGRASDLFEHNRRFIRALTPAFTSIWLEDHLQWGETPVIEGLSTLSYFAAEFPDLRVGTLVVNQLFRNPALLAKMAANLQLMSHGRLILGLGAGWKEDEYNAYGYPRPMPDARARLEQLEEAINVIRALWNARPATFEGEYYGVHEAYCEPRPSPAVPLLIGGGGERRTLALVARYADWWNFNSCTVEEYARKVAVLKEHCERVGRDPREIRLTYLGTVLMSEESARLQQQNPQKHFIAGSGAEIIHEIERFNEIGVSQFMLRMDDLETAERFVAGVAPHFA